MIFYLNFHLLFTLDSKSDADLSETSVWLAHLGASSNKSSALGHCLCISEGPYFPFCFNGK